MLSRSNGIQEPVFSRGDVAKILNVTALTIANREKAKKYPDPQRDLNNYRIYGLNDIFNLQLITYGSVDPRPVISVLWDKGVREQKFVSQLIDTALSRRVGEAT